MQSEPEAEEIEVLPPRRGVLVQVLAVLLVALLSLAGYLAYSLWSERLTTQDIKANWSPELDELWSAFVDHRRPTLVSVLDYPMAAIQGFGIYADLRLQDWDTLAKSEIVKNLRGQYGDKGIRRLYFTPRHDLDTYFQLGKQLGPRVPALSLLSIREMSWQQMADNNIIFIGSQEFYENLLGGLPVDLAFRFDKQGFRNVSPQGTEPGVFLDHPPTDVEEDGESIAVVTHMPGPRGLGVVRTFGANRGGARLGAVKAFTEPHYANSLVQKLRTPSGKLPRYFQVVLNVKYKSAVPTDIEYITHRELRMKSQGIAK